MLRCLVLWLLLAVAGTCLAATQSDQWRAVVSIGPVQVYAQDTDSGFDRVRASVTVCTDLETVADYTADASTLMDWVAYAQAVELLEADDNHTLYYLKTAAPWPMRSRDMIYQLTPRFDDQGRLHIRMDGVPDALPVRADAVRMDSVEGDWLFTADGGEVTVQLTLHMNPGRVPRFMANGRIARTVGMTLQALGEKFPCSTVLSIPDQPAAGTP
jgi:hypothetical protein